MEEPRLHRILGRRFASPWYGKWALAVGMLLTGCKALHSDQPWWQSPLKSAAPTQASASGDDLETDPVASESPLVDEPADESSSTTTSRIAAQLDAGNATSAAAFMAPLASDAWVQTVPRPSYKSGSVSAPADFRWRLPGWDEFDADPAALAWLHRIRSPQPGLAQPPSDVVRDNAAILLARHRDARALDDVAAIVRRGDKRLSQRQAAAEALARVPDLGGATLRKLLDSAPAEQAPELTAELFIALAQVRATEDDARFSQGLLHDSPLIRLAVVTAWRERTGPLPEQALRLRHDQDQRVRVAALRTFAAHRHPQAYAIAAAALRDGELPVRLGAIAALGDLATAESVTRLEQVMVQEPEILRTAAASALGQAEAWEPLSRAVEDRSWHVRRAVAEALATRPCPEALRMARQLAQDSSPMVQAQVVTSLAEWSLEEAQPVLWILLESGSFQPRKQAARLLAEHLPEVRDFPYDAPQAERSAALIRLRQQGVGAPATVDSDVERAAHHALANDPANLRGKNEATPESIAVVERWLDRHAQERGQRVALSSLAELQDQLLPALTFVAVEKRQVLPEPVYVDLLAPREEVFAMVERLNDPQPAQRRTAADRLAREAQRRRFPELATLRLTKLAARENDPLVLRSLLTAFEENPTTAACWFAVHCLGHSAPEVRRRAALHLGRWGGTDDQEALAQAAGDVDVHVARAAVEGLGRLDARQHAHAVFPLLQSRDAPLRLAAALTLARWEVPEGTAALERLAQASDPAERRRTALAIAETGDAAFIPLLVQLLDDRRQGIDQAALAGLEELTAGSSAEPAPPAHDPAAWPNLEERKQAWRDWWRQAAGKVRR